MLRKELLVFRKKKGNIIPCYLYDTEIAQNLIDLYIQNKGEKYKKILKKREKLEKYDFKVVRGLSALLERRCQFKDESSLPGKEVRCFLFDQGLVRTLRERDEVLKKAAHHFQASSSDVEQAMFSDLREEQVLSEFNSLNADELIRWYNLSLTQTLLFDALGVHFQVVGNYQQIYRKIKYLGLMYEIDDGIRVTGPGSLFKKNRKYGTSLAKLLPEIMNSQEWEIHAIIETQVSGEPRLFHFDLTTNTKIPFPKNKESLNHFDSSVEEQFYHDFNSLNSGWDIIREPEAVKAGTYVIIPDFGFYKDHMSHYLEIVGFWTPEYLEKKIGKLKEVNAPITVAVNENLDCKKQDFHGEVIFYTNRVPLLKIINILREIERNQVDKELRELGEIYISQDVVSIADIATEYNVNPKTIREREVTNYQVIGDQMVSNDLLEKIKTEIRSEEDYVTVEEILKRYQVSMLALDVMGFKVLWDGLQPTKVVEKSPK